MSTSVTLTQEQQDALDRGEEVTITIRPPKKVWEPEGGEWALDFQIPYEPDHDPDHWVFDSRVASGCLRKAKEEAIRAGEEIRRYARLLAYRDQFAPGYVVPELGVEACAIYFEEADGGFRYRLAAHMNMRAACVVYMPKRVAEELARKLNSGEVVL